MVTSVMKTSEDSEEMGTFVRRDERGKIRTSNPATAHNQTSMPGVGLERLEHCLTLPVEMANGPRNRGQSLRRERVALLANPYEGRVADVGMELFSP
ncbi:Protein of unknown function [Gryllus bimaculatus]|nr:Protein of unknown function [Gryllus bimaculatus]